MQQEWRYKPITLEQWKVNCLASSHVRLGDELSFGEGQGQGQGQGVITCYIKNTSVYLGAYFINGDKYFGTLPGTGWNHE